jgi:hypothetical protein
MGTSMGKGAHIMHHFMQLASTGASPEDVVALFASDAYVLPTLWTECKTREELLAYFAYFLVPGRCGSYRSVHVSQLGEDQLVTGLWDWWAGEPDQVTCARYTAVVGADPEGRHVIKHLHSSVDPSGGIA